MSTNVTLNGGISNSQETDITVSDLAPNNYLTIVWNNTNSMGILKDLDINEDEKQQYTVELRNATESSRSASISSGSNNSGKNKYINIQSMAKYLAQNTIPSGTKRTVVNALINLASGSKTGFNEKTTNLVVGTFGTIANKVAQKFGYSDPHELFASIAKEDNIQILKVFGDKTQNFINNKIAQIRKKNKTNLKSTVDNDKNKTYIGLILGLTQSDTESYEITIPRRKVENGSDYTTHLLPQPFKKEFSGYLTNRVLTSTYQQKADLEAIEYTKNKLIEIAQSHTTFDIYIRLSKDKMYKKTNVVFSSLSFTKDESSGNTYSFSFTVEPIYEFKMQTFVSDRKYFPTSSKNSSGSGNSGSSTRGTGSSKGSSSSGRKNSGSTIKTTSSGKPITLISNNPSIPNGTFKNKSGLMNYISKLNSNQYSGGPYALLESTDGTTYKIISTNDVTYVNGIYVRKVDGYLTGPASNRTWKINGSNHGGYIFPRNGKTGYRIVGMQNTTSIRSK